MCAQEAHIYMHTQACIYMGTHILTHRLRPHRICHALHRSLCIVEAECVGYGTPPESMMRYVFGRRLDARPVYGLITGIAILRRGLYGLELFRAFLTKEFLASKATAHSASDADAGGGGTGSGHFKAVVNFALQTTCRYV